jgi:PKD repeat protein
MSLSWSKIAGTQLGKFILGLTGVTLKNNNGNLDVRNNNDNAYADVSAKNIAVNDNISGRKVTLAINTATQLDYSLTLPINTGSSNQVLTTDGSGNLSWTAQSSINTLTVNSTSFYYGSSATTDLVELSSSTLIDKVTVIVDESFVSTGTFQVSVGVSGQQEKIMNKNAVTTTSTGRTDVLYSGQPNYLSTESLKLYTYGNATAGSGRVVVTYADIVVPTISNFSATPLVGIPPLTVTFTDTTLNSPTSWLWDFKNDGTATSTQQNSTYTYTTTGTYSVTLTTSRDGMTSTMTKTNYVSVGGVPSTAVIIVPDVTNYAVVDQSLSSNVSWYRVSVPVSATLNITISGTPSAINTMLGLYNNSGALLNVYNNSNFPSTQNTTLTRSMSPGIYYFAIGRVNGPTPVVFNNAFQAQASAAVGTGILLTLELVLPPSSMSLGYEVI